MTDKKEKSNADKISWLKHIRNKFDKLCLRQKEKEQKEYAGLEHPDGRITFINSLLDDDFYDQFDDSETISAKDMEWFRNKHKEEYASGKYAEWYVPTAEIIKKEKEEEARNKQNPRKPDNDRGR